MKINLKKNAILHVNDHLPLSIANNPPRIIGYDTEATGLHWENQDRLYCFSCVFDLEGKRHKYYWEFEVDPFTRLPNFKDQEGLNTFKNFLWQNPNVEKVAANMKFDWHMSVASLGSWWEPKGILHDVLLAAWCCNTREPSYSLKNLVKKYLNRDRSDEQRLKDLTIKCRELAKEKGYNCGPGISTVPEDYWLTNIFFPEAKLLKEYNLYDSEDALDLWYFYEEGMKQLEVRETYDRERELMLVLYKMEKRGVRFLEENTIEEIDKAQQEIMRLNYDLQTFAMRKIGKTMNFNSPKQMADLLYHNPNGFNFPIIRFTDSGLPKTDINVIQELYKYYTAKGSESGEFIEKYFKWSSLEKGIEFLKSYIKFAVKDPHVTGHDLLGLHNKKSIHTSFNQIFDNFEKSYGAKSTGRLSSSNPNLHQAPDPTKKEHVLIDARKSLGPRDGYYYYLFDLPQIELRIFAFRMGQINPNNTLYLEFMKEDADPHTVTANAVPYLAQLDDRKKARQLGKHSNFTLANAGGKDALHVRYGIPLDEGELLVAGFHEANPEARKRQQSAMREAIKTGYVTTITGRKIGVDLSRDDRGNYEVAYRATAYDIQGSAKDLIREMMIEIQEYFDSYNQNPCKPAEIDAHIVLQVHDELAFEVYKYHSYKWFLKNIIKIGENVLRRYLPFPTKLELDKCVSSWSSTEKKKVQL